MPQGRDVARVRDHRGHDLHTAFDRRAIARAQLRHEDVGPAIGQAKRPHSEEGDVLFFEREIGDRFVAPDVQQTDGHGTRREGRDDLTVRVGLFILGRRAGSLEKEKLRAEQTDPARPQDRHGTSQKNPNTLKRIARSPH